MLELELELEKRAMHCDRGPCIISIMLWGRLNPVWGKGIALPQVLCGRSRVLVLALSATGGRLDNGCDACLYIQDA